MATPPAPPLIFTANNGVCGERLALTADGQVVTGKTAVTVPDPSLPGQLLFVDVNTGRVRRSVATVLATWHICSKICLLAAMRSTNNTPYRFMRDAIVIRNCSERFGLNPFDRTANEVNFSEIVYTRNTQGEERCKNESIVASLNWRSCAR